MLTMRLPLLAVVGLVVATPALAQQAKDDAPPPAISQADLDRDYITIGGGVGYFPSYEGSNDYIAIPIGAVRGRYKGFNFASRGLELSADLIRDHASSGVNLELGPVVALNLNRTNRIVDPRVRALGELGTSFEVGGYAGISKTGVITSAYDTIGVRVGYVRDVTSVHDSYVITPSITYGTPLSRRAYVALVGAAEIVGDRYARTYFSVDAPGSARSGLPVFANPRGGLKNYTGSILANYALTGDLTHGLGLFALGSYSRLQGDFARSPLTSVAGSPNQWYGAIGIGYTF